MMQWNCIQIEVLIDEDDHSMRMSCFAFALQGVNRLNKGGAEDWHYCAQRCLSQYGYGTHMNDDHDGGDV